MRLLRSPFRTHTAALDVGTATTRLIAGDRLIEEPSVVRIRMRDGALDAVGHEASAGVGRLPAGYEVVWPVRRGVPADAIRCEEMLRAFSRDRGLSLSKVIVTVPCACTEVERGALIDCVRNATGAAVQLRNRSIAAALGAALPIQDAKGYLVVDVGAGCTEIALISLSGIVSARTLLIGGGDMDARIVSRIRECDRLEIGLTTAECLKAALAGSPRAVKGRCLQSGLPRQVPIRPDELKDAIAPVHSAIATGVHSVMEQAPPELVADLAETGIVLTGGCASVAGLAPAIARRCAVPVLPAEEPHLAVIRGLRRMIDGSMSEKEQRCAIWSSTSDEKTPFRGLEVGA